MNVPTINLENLRSPTKKKQVTHEQSKRRIEGLSKPNSNNDFESISINSKDDSITGDMRKEGGRTFHGAFGAGKEMSRNQLITPPKGNT
jgi:hypothetical protein